MLGEGRMWSPRTGWADASKVLRENQLEPLELGPKEGLALINGTQMVTSIGALGKLWGIFKNIVIVFFMYFPNLKCSQP